MAGGGVAAEFPERFHRLSLAERREALRSRVEAESEEWEASDAGPALNELADLMVESAVGCLPLPLGLATGFLIDGQPVVIPMAVEEPSVIAAASFAARIVRRGGGFSTWAAEPVMRAQVFLEGVPAGAEQGLPAAEGEIRRRLDALQPSLKARGGGFRGLEVLRLPESGTLRVDLRIDVRDAMGANILNRAAEHIRPFLEELCGGRALMCILGNAAEERRAGARFTVPLGALPLGGGPRGGPDLSREELARRIVAAGELAREDAQRAVTHNKGIMNGITSLALATMNDARALEAAAHAWAARDGRYRALSFYRFDGQSLEGELELPLPMAAVGGAVGFHPASRLALKVLGRPDGRRLARIAAALGLAQNLAALLALVSGGIQRGHMRYHAARLAYQAGARGAEVRLLAERLAERGAFSREEAASELERLRKGST
jgi:hydroxymethylglutaryl-CoA reductase